ncbi:MAG: hypothetical protein EAZ70_03655 [Runella slithyformis]|nr:MAG: hypothetical protein EAY79_03290 [Runella slithyformis]TAF28916.1 MAG: hypothetical protein EAZ70_03655 [Runella slithyformis]TAF47969.1 MAG: hypothetical protein EAZ63_06500 [Runella slithyformis]TAF82455.1 MAG: hypothetical protein EAZ50_03830 [Runella slithyformis]
MKSPQKNGPVEGSSSVESKAGDAPTIKIEEVLSANIAENAPSLTPPSTSEATAFGAGVWNNDKRVNGLYSTHDARNAWMSIVGVGWVKLATSNDSANEAMTILASHARVKNSQINYSVDAGLVNEMYVW